MKRVLGTVRSKLVGLVLLPLVLLLVILAITEHVLERQILGEASRRVTAAQGALQMELDDDLRSMHAALLQLSASQRLHAALEAKDDARAARTVERFARGFPKIAVALAGSDGQVRAQTGFDGLTTLSKVPGLDVPEEAGTVREVLLDAGCSGAGASPARALIARAGGAGFVVFCEDLDEHFLERTGTKLGLALALVDERGGHRFAARAAAFPASAPTVRGESLLHDDGAELWALSEFCPRLVKNGGGECAMEAMAALSVGHIRDVVRADFFWIIVAVFVAGGLAVGLGGRLALRMTSAVDHIVEGCRHLEQGEYAPISVVRTGDELEELGEGFNVMVAGLEERDRLRTTFGKYMTDAVVSHLLEGKVELGGDMLPVTILFSDIRGFTSISEHLDAQSLVALLNEYFTDMVDIVMDEGGVVDKYIGDAIMVVFGAPVPKSDDATRAVRAAVRMREALVRLNERLVARGTPIIRTGIGIHSGEVVAGNIGSERRMEYTVIGDAVNVASRLEGVTKELGADIVVSDATRQLVGDAVPMRYLDSINVKGRDQAIAVYAVDDFAASCPGSTTRRFG
jgi:adenylate cyclase